MVDVPTIWEQLVRVARVQSVSRVFVGEVRLGCRQLLQSICVERWVRGTSSAAVREYLRVGAPSHTFSNAPLAPPSARRS